jgi:glutathione peroxidase
MENSNRRKAMKWLYPLWMKLTKWTGMNTKTLHNKNGMQPVSPFYTLSIQLNSGKQLSFDTLKGKKVLIVNTASNCGYTPQYAELQKLYEANKDGLEIIGFPANDFKEQEKGSDEEIASFCQVNYGVSFPLAKKATVVKEAAQHEVFKWLTDKNQNGWNDAPPSWNFSKYLINEDGVLTHYFDPSVSPLSKEVTEAISKG